MHANVNWNRYQFVSELCIQTLKHSLVTIVFLIMLTCMNRATISKSYYKANFSSRSTPGPFNRFYGFIKELLSLVN